MDVSDGDRPAADDSDEALMARIARGDERAYRVLARQSQHEPAKHWGAVQPGLFDMIVAQHLPPAPGPEQGRDGQPQISPGTAE